VSTLSVTVIGAGVIGLWQAYELARRGHRVALREALPESQIGAASRIAGAMLAPYCEAEGSEPVVQRLGLEGARLWREAYPGVVPRGSLVVASPRDQGELARFQRLTEGHRLIDAQGVGELEPELAGRFARALYFPDEAHMAPRPALAWLLAEVRRLGGEVRLGEPVPSPVWLAGGGDVVIDCRGISARSEVAGLRGVRGEMAIVRAAEIALTRPVRLLHPRFPIYVVPWGEGEYMVGATVIEREDAGPVTVRSALDLLGTACAVHPGFAEAEIVELSAGVRPAFADNLPRVVLESRTLRVNGAYRHGFLMAPVLARAAADLLEGKRSDAELVSAQQA
jgi:glycine oxidase